MAEATQVFRAVTEVQFQVFQVVRAVAASIQLLRQNPSSMLLKP